MFYDFAAKSDGRLGLRVETVDREDLRFLLADVEMPRLCDLVQTVDKSC